MKILIACEFSQTVAEQFAMRGHDVMSCDLIPAEKDYPHHIGDVLELMKAEKWDMMIAHPPCTYTALSGNRWYAGTQKRLEGFEFFMEFVNATYIPRRAVEHPMSVVSSMYRPPDQYIHPYMFGMPYQKKTGLWLFNLPKLYPTNVVEHAGVSHVWTAGNVSYEGYDPATKGMSWGSEEMKKYRQRFPVGIATAMAEQWDIEAMRPQKMGGTRVITEEQLEEIMKDYE